MAGAGAAGGAAPVAIDSTVDQFSESALQMFGYLSSIFQKHQPDFIQKINALLGNVLYEAIGKADFSQELVSCAKAFLEENGRPVASNSRFFTQEASGDNNARLVEKICTCIIENSDKSVLVDDGLAKINLELDRLLKEHRPSAPSAPAP